MKLNQLKPAKGSKRASKRVGRGKGTGLGRTAGRGEKGLRSRSGGGTPPGYEGGQMPLQRRIPKRGFHNPFRKEYCIVNVKDLNRFAAGTSSTSTCCGGDGEKRQARRQAAGGGGGHPP